MPQIRDKIAGDPGEVFIAANGGRAWQIFVAEEGILVETIKAAVVEGLRTRIQGGGSLLIPGVSARFAILNPCAKRWTGPGGDGRKRFCDECQTYVHALDQYSVEEFDELKRKSGRVCGFLTGESLPEPRSRRAILIGAFLTAISPLMAQSGRLRIRVSDITGAVIPGAEVALLGMDGNALRTENANEQGEFIFSDLPIGNSRVESES